jgi:hypothetical protein
MLKDVTKAMFAENVNSTFNLRQETGPAVPLELTELQEGAPHPKFEQFSLLFKGPREVSLPQRTYTVDHVRLGTFLLFVVPIRQDANGIYYESVFSRSISQKAEL